MFKVGDRAKINAANLDYFTRHYYHELEHFQEVGVVTQVTEVIQVNYRDGGFVRGFPYRFQEIFLTPLPLEELV